MENHHFAISKIDSKAKPVKKDVDFAWLNYSQMLKFTKWENTQKIVTQLIKQIKENENM